MTKPLRKYSKEELPGVIQRRLKNVTYGLGYWAAITFQGPEAVSEATKQQLRTNPQRDSWGK